MKMPKPVGPKLTRKRLQELTDLTAADGRKYHDDLPATWDNAEFVAEHRDEIVPKPAFPGGYDQNEALKQAIAKAFNEIKPSDADGSPWLLAWRMYPNADHPMWKNGGDPECGCNCGCFIPRDSSD